MDCRTWVVTRVESDQPMNPQHAKCVEIARRETYAGIEDSADHATKYKKL